MIDKLQMKNEKYVIKINHMRDRIRTIKQRCEKEIHLKNLSLKGALRRIQWLKSELKTVHWISYICSVALLLAKM